VRHLSYLVIGWYSDPLRWDPVRLYEDKKKRGDKTYKRVYDEVSAQVDDDAAVCNHWFKQVYGWSYNWQEEVNHHFKRKKRPQQTLFVGQLTGVEWDPEKSYLTPKAQRVGVALGNTTAQALSALLASEYGKKKPAEVETFLNGIQFDLLRDYATAAGQANLSDALHQRDFTPVPAGHASEKESGRIWLIKRIDSKDPAEGTGVPADASLAMEERLPQDLGNALNVLNRSQEEFDILAAGVATRRGQIFADWTKYLASKDEDVDKGAAAKEYIEKEIAALNGWVETRKKKQKARDDAKLTLVTLLSNTNAAHKSASSAPDAMRHPGMKDYELDSVTAPRYYQPNDPVVVLSGVDPSSRSVGDPEKKGSLICRLSDEITWLPDDARATGTPLSRDAFLKSRLRVQPERIHLATLFKGLGDKIGKLRGLCEPGDWAEIISRAFSSSKIAEASPPADHLNSLCVEACLLNPWMGKLIGDSGFNKSQEDYIEKRANNSDDVPPSPIGMPKYAPLFMPLILQWETAFKVGTPASYPETWALENFELSVSNPEITYLRGMPRETATYRGTTTLAHNVQANLIDQVGRFLKDHPLAPEDDPLRGISNNPSQMMAASLEGFHRQLLMRDQSLQMRVVAPPRPAMQKVDPDEISQDYIFGCKVGNAVLHREIHLEDDKVVRLEECDASCLGDLVHYNPLRHGVLHITRLRVLDTFGQIRDIIPPNLAGGVVESHGVILSAHMKREMNKWAGFERAATLPLRLAQPARLSFRYRPLEMNSDPASSPIFGWVLFNRFDHALAIYDQEGRPIGSFNLHGPPWQEAPGANRGVANPHLREFLDHLGRGVPTDPKDPNYKTYYETFRAFLDKLIRTIDDVAAGIEPDGGKQDHGLAMLIGRPLALVVADLRLDLYGTLHGDETLPGLPAIDQSREAFDAVKSAQRYVEKDRPSAAFARVRIPVRLGDDSKVHDGLVGYFVKGQNAAATYGTFYYPPHPPRQPGLQAPEAARGDGPNVWPAPLTGTNCLSVAPADKFPQTVVMLVDPRAAVHASIGILPVKSIALPPAQYADALKRIDTTFLVAPILSGAGSVALPVPNVAGHAWSWLTRQADVALFTKRGAGVRRWVTQDLVESPNPRAAFSAPPLRMSEGWLHLYPVGTPSSPDKQAANRGLLPPSPYDILVKRDASGDLNLTPETASLHGAGIAMAETDDGKRFIGYWNDERDYVSWKVSAHGGYNVAIKYSAREDSQFDIEVLNSAGQTVWTQHYRAPCTASWDDAQCPPVMSSRSDPSDRIYAVPPVWFGLNPGEHEVRVKPANRLWDINSNEWIAKRWKAVNLWSVELTKLVDQSGPKISLNE
jgi:hypothetical protein